MPTLSSLGVGLSLVSACLLLALVAELYYLFWWKRPSSISLNPQLSQHQPSCKDLFLSIPNELKGDEIMEAELMRLHGLSGPPRFLFTITEETKEDLVESEDGNCCSAPFMTPLSSPPFFTPPLTPLEQSFNPLFEAFTSASPPPKFKFLKDAEEKLYRKALMEETLKALSSVSEEDQDGSFITIVIGKNRERGHRHHHHHHHHSSSSQVIPLGSSPSTIRPSHGKPN